MMNGKRMRRRSMLREALGCAFMSIYLFGGYADAADQQLWSKFWDRIPSINVRAISNALTSVGFLDEDTSEYADFIDHPMTDFGEMTTVYARPHQQQLKHLSTDPEEFSDFAGHNLVHVDEQYTSPESSNQEKSLPRTLVKEEFVDLEDSKMSDWEDIASRYLRHGKAVKRIRKETKHISEADLQFNDFDDRETLNDAFGSTDISNTKREEDHVSKKNLLELDGQDVTDRFNRILGANRNRNKQKNALPFSYFTLGDISSPSTNDELTYSIASDNEAILSSVQATGNRRKKRDRNKRKKKKRLIAPVTLPDTGSLTAIDGTSDSNFDAILNDAIDDTMLDQDSNATINDLFSNQSSEQQSDAYSSAKSSIITLIAGPQSSLTKVIKAPRKKKRNKRRRKKKVNVDVSFTADEDPTQQGSVSIGVVDVEQTPKCRRVRRLRRRRKKKKLKRKIVFTEEPPEDDGEAPEDDGELFTAEETGENLGIFEKGSKSKSSSKSKSTKAPSSKSSKSKSKSTKAPSGSSKSSSSKSSSSKSRSSSRRGTRAPGSRSSKSSGKGKGSSKSKSKREIDDSIECIDEELDGLDEELDGFDEELDGLDEEDIDEEEENLL